MDVLSIGLVLAVGVAVLAFASIILDYRRVTERRWP